jgi:hypothetical protein
VLEVAKNNYDTFFALTTKVAMLHDQMDRQREKYRKWRRIVFGDQRDPLAPLSGVGEPQPMASAADAAAPSIFSYIG